MGAMERITIELSADLAAVLRERAAEREYPSTAAAIEEAVREWVEEPDLETLRQLIRKGVDSGPGLPADDVFTELRARFPQA